MPKNVEERIIDRPLDPNLRRAGGGSSSAAHNHNTAYYTKSEFIDESAGVADAGKPVKLGADGQIGSLVASAVGAAPENTYPDDIADTDEVITLKAGNIWRTSLQTIASFFDNIFASVDKGVNGGDDHDHGFTPGFGGGQLYADNIDDSATTNKFATAAELTKLGGIEANADVTDAGNVGSSIHGATEKTTFHDDDKIAGIDTEASNVLKWWKWSTIKSALTTLFNGLYVGLTGTQTMEGDLQVGDGTATPGIAIRIRGANGASRTLGFHTGTLLRWAFQVTGTTESGSNTGSNWVLLARDDAGNSLSVPLVFDRASGRAVFGGNTNSPTLLAKIDFIQPSTTAALPVISIDQRDVSEPMIRFATTIGTGNAIEAVGAKTLTVTHFVKIELPGGLIRYVEAGTIA